MNLSARERDEAYELASRSAVSGGVLTLRAGGKTLAGADVDALLARAVARERVELELDVLAYEQGGRDADGNIIRNRNHVRFRDGLMMRLGRTGRNAPFLRDHRQDDSHARSGTVVESRTEKLTEDGHYQILQTVRLSDPGTVERALRGLLSGVSVGWRRNGPPHCTACGFAPFTRQASTGKLCTHCPGDTLEDGSVVEWEYQDAELIETSEVVIPAVQSAGIDGIRAALSAAHNRGMPPQGNDMSKLASIANTLGLAATAGEDEVTAAVERALVEREALRQQLATAQSSIAEINAKLATHEAALLKQHEDTWIATGVAEGKITLGAHEQAMRAYFRSNPDGARTMLAASPRITPVGQQSQLGAAPPPQPATGARAVLAAQGKDYDAVKRAARKFGAADPDKALEAYAAAMTEGA